jgi:hypothetical protein
MKTINLKNQNNQTLPAEIRSYENGVMVVLVKDFKTAKLVMTELTNVGGDTWSSAGGEYTGTYPGQEFVTGGTVLVRVPKK